MPAGFSNQGQFQYRFLWKRKDLRSSSAVMPFFSTSSAWFLEAAISMVERLSSFSKFLGSTASRHLWTEIDEQLTVSLSINSDLTLRHLQERDTEASHPVELFVSPSTQ